MNFSETITQQTLVGLPAVPQQLGVTSTVNSGKIDFSLVARAFFNFMTGVFGGTSPTLSAACQVQVSVDGVTWFSSTNSSTSATVTAASSQETFEIRGDQLAQQSAADGRKYRYARLQAVCTITGTGPTIPVAIAALGQAAYQGPASQGNDASVIGQMVAA